MYANSTGSATMVLSKKSARLLQTSNGEWFLDVGMARRTHTTLAATRNGTLVGVRSQVNKYGRRTQGLKPKVSWT